jgi:FtsZ-binding cell division protein ZapB
MSEVLIAQLQKRIDELTNESASLKTEAKSRRHKNKSLQEELDGLKTQVDAITKERDSLKAASTARPGELQAIIDDLRGQIRTRDHRDAFKRLAKDAGARTEDTALTDLWNASGYKADSDTIDDAKITAAITEALAGRDYLKAVAASDEANEEAARAAQQTAHGAANGNRQPGPGANRGSGAGDPAAENDARFKVLTGHGNSFRIA